ncbi:MAG: hypothetical protein EOO71_13380, partial [Myxococcaceae bacterium]
MDTHPPPGEPERSASSELAADFLEVLGSRGGKLFALAEAEAIEWRDEAGLLLGTGPVFQDDRPEAPLVVVARQGNREDRVRVRARNVFASQLVDADGPQVVAALRDDGTVVTWGGGAGHPALLPAELGARLTGVRTLCSTAMAFAALKHDGSVVVWGDAAFGGVPSEEAAARLTHGVTKVTSNRSAFAALMDDGSVVTWGKAASGGDSHAVAGKLTSGVERIQGCWNFFIAFKKG